MKIDTARLRPQLLTYLRAHGVVPTTDGYIPCQNPAHADGPPYKNAHVVPSGEAVKCFACGADYDVIQVEQWRSGSDFPTAARAVAQAVGVVLDGPVEPVAPSHLDKPAKTPKPDAVPVPLDWETASQKFTRKAFDTKFARETWGEVALIGPWAARDEQGRVIAVDVRFEKKLEDGSLKKSVITHFWNGTHIVSKGAPLVLFGRDIAAANPTFPVLISEGCKDWQASKAVPGFAPVTWNRGVENAGKAPWEALAGRIEADSRVYYYGDDDTPGRKAARVVRSVLEKLGCVVKLCAPMVHGDGFGLDDVIAAGKTPEEIREWILNGPELAEEEEDVDDGSAENHTGGGHGIGGKNPDHIKNDSKENLGQGKQGASKGGSAMGGHGNDHADKSDPFTILGIGDDRRAYFLDDSGRLTKETLKGLSKPFLLTLTDQFYWLENYTFGGKMSWDSAINDIIMLSKRKDFDLENVRGRGAWRERDGRLCYHDGRTTYGEPDPSRLYVRRRRKSIGLDREPAPAAVRREILDAVSQMSFASKADTVRALSWAVLAPFGSALPWRPAVLLTGDSASGKTTLLTQVIVPLTAPIFVNGGESTAAGGRQKVENDGTPFVVDETEDDTKEGAGRRKGWFSLMRQSTSDDAPETLKGTPNGEGPVSFTMRQMYLFAAISPDPGAIQDDNRISPVTMVSRGDSLERWLEIKGRVRSAVTADICEGVRSFTWSHLGAIIADSDRISDVIQSETPLDNRRAYADALLFSAFWQVYMDAEPGLDELRAFVKTFYAQTPPSEKRNEAAEMIDTIFQYVLPLQGDFKERHNVEFYLKGLSTGWVESESESSIGGQRELSKNERLRYKQTLLENLGIGLDKDGEVAFGVSNVMLKKITGRDQYRLILERHTGLKRKTQTESVSGKAMRATVIRGLLGPTGEGAPF